MLKQSTITTPVGLESLSKLTTKKMEWSMGRYSIHVLKIKTEFMPATSKKLKGFIAFGL